MAIWPNVGIEGLSGKTWSPGNSSISFSYKLKGNPWPAASAGRMGWHMCDALQIEGFVCFRISSKRVTRGSSRYSLTLLVSSTSHG